MRSTVSSNSGIHSIIRFIHSFTSQAVYERSEHVLAVALLNYQTTYYEANKGAAAGTKKVKRARGLRPSCGEYPTPRRKKCTQRTSFSFSDRIYG
jgi:hypothetical protein